MDSSDDDFEVCDGDEVQNFNYLCFFCEKTYSDFQEMFDHALTNHNFNIQEITKLAKLTNEYDWIKLINFIRKINVNLVVDDIVNGLWKDDCFLRPEIPDDNLLFIDYEDAVGCKYMSTNTNKLEETVVELKAKISAYEETISLLKQKTCELMANCDDELAENNKCRLKSAKMTAEDDAYFTGYSHHSIHDIMIKDTVRTESYRKFIEENGSIYFKDKVVLDVGCGTGILSMFAARSGATHVYGVDCADIIYDAMAIVEKNGYKDKITLIHGKLEDITLPCDKVDVVISEWMGYFLIYESMLDSVLYACRTLLNRESGLVFPRQFSLNLVGADLSTYRARNLDCWDSVFGLDMSAMRPSVLREVAVEVVPPADVVTEPCLLRDYDVQHMAFSGSDSCPQSINQTFSLLVKRSGSFGAVVAYFDTFFLHQSAADDPETSSRQVSFSTGPLAQQTHWQQSLLILETPFPVVEGQQIQGTLNIDRHALGRRGLCCLLEIPEQSISQRFEFS